MPLSAMSRIKTKVLREADDSFGHLPYLTQLETRHGDHFKGGGHCKIAGKSKENQGRGRRPVILQGKSKENQRKAKVKPKENQRKIKGGTKGKPKENQGKPIKSKENQRKTKGKPRTT